MSLHIDPHILDEEKLNFASSTHPVKYQMTPLCCLRLIFALQYGPLDFGVRLQEGDFLKYFKPTT